MHGNTALAAKQSATTGLSWREPTDPRNTADAPRFTGRLTYNVFEPEGGPGVPGYFWDGIYLEETDHGIVSPKKVVAVGASIDYQRGLNVTLSPFPAADGETRTVVARQNYVAWNVDVFVDRYQVVAAAEWFDADAPGHRGDVLAYSGGFNYG